MMRRLLFTKLRPYSTQSSTVEHKEIDHFRRFSSDWWDELGRMKPLHALNKLRVPLVRDGLINAGSVPPEHIPGPTPLKGLSILDVGCGGGILAEPLARIGAQVTGLDPNVDLVEIAKSHAQLQHLPNLNYTTSPVEEHVKEFGEKYDAVVTSETVEHVANQGEFLKACVKCVKPGGSIFVTTVNKTMLSNFLAIYLAENVLTVTPKGTHDFNKFLEPHKLQRMLEDENCRTVVIHGMIYVPFVNQWEWFCDSSVCYALHGIKLQKAN